MRAAWACLALVAAPALAGGSAPAALQVRAADAHTLQDVLLELIEQRLPTGYGIDHDQAWLALTGPLPAGAFEVRPAWDSRTMPPASPFPFELAFRTPGTGSIRATLAVPLLRAVRVAARRLRKGSAVECADFATSTRDLRRVPARAVPAACAIAPGSVALRDIGAGDVLRDGDTGPLPDVLAGAPVRVNVAVGGVSVSVTATALGDAQVGDRIDVRLPRSTRVLMTRVTAPGAAELVRVP